MSRIRLLGASFLALACGIGSAAAADLGTYSPAPTQVYSPASAFSWNGGYIGGLLGYGWGTASLNNGFDWTADGLTGGAYAGYNFQPTPNFVLGVEGDLTASGMEGSSGLLGGPKIENNWDGTLRARAGFAFDRFLVYGTGGLAVGGLKASNAHASDTSTQTGWTIGGGLEAAITNVVTARIEYRYTDLGSNDFAIGPTTNIGFTSNQVLAGVGVKF